ncbi:hypothetical protein SAMN05216303_108234 [Rhodoferax sp. OV413]|uniref:hypothetical protein n=1 Tax=Rhodoferax sp. OV413 TaxID=1855285 RepID=UPI000881E5D9|nr:hypothetical protein [Rhodoferax sp. OV413]SDP88091.1 hypothetical protein SAMN05216303_108234 [Rhodoferax sp. OV413]
MTTAAHSTAHESIHGTLTQRAGDTPDVAAVLEAVGSTWQTMAAQLEPVIGVRGVSVLLNRALYLTVKSYPWLTPTNAQEAADAMENIKLRFVGRTALEAAEGGCALLVTFTELLASLIGESLTERLLACVWLPPSPPFEQDTHHD